MRNIRRIFQNDVKNVCRNVIGIVVVIGLVIVPCLYAWFNIAGSWDPYGNTGNLKIAVANIDEGYQSDLVPVEVNIGESVTSSLRANDSFNCVFVNRKHDAVEGVRSGKYYAAVIIPKSFSADMMTLFSTEVKHADIEYYENQKSNAIAQIVTEKGSNAVKSQVNETFTKTVTKIGLNTVESLLDTMSSDDATNFVANLSKTLGQSATGLRNASSEVDAFSGLLGSSASSLKSTGELLGKTGTTSTDAKSLLADAKSGLSSVEDALGSATSEVDSAISESVSGLDGVSSSVDSALDAGTAHADTTAKQLNSVASDLKSQIDKTAATAKQLRELSGKVDATKYPDVKSALDYAATSLENLNTARTKLYDSLTSAANSLTQGTSDVASTKAEVKAAVDAAKSSVTGVKGDYEKTLKTQVGDLKSSISNVANSSSSISSNLDSTVSNLSSASNSLTADLERVGNKLTKTSGDLTTSAEKIERLRAALDEAAASGDLTQVRALIGSDSESLAAALTSPVTLDRKAVYHIRNYGSAMAPFYTILSLWVGAIVLAAMLKVQVKESFMRSLAPIRLHEVYLGRFVAFALIGLMQATLVCAGDILFFGIQCQHPLLYLLTGWLASFVFVNIVYTLTVSFGDIGKALAVVLLVMQVGGSGGTFPIEMTAPVFQAIYPFLPFTHGINAMHAAMAGSFGAEYWIEMLVLASYLIPSLALGIVFRRPVIRLNNWIIEQLEETKLM